MSPSERERQQDFPFSICHFSFIIGITPPVITVNHHPKCRSGTCMGDVRIAQPQARADELENRLIDFAVRIIKLSANLPKTPAGKHIAGQILRSGTSPAPNYGEARGAESNADFVHKLGIVLKELNETSIWLRVIERSQLLKRELLVEIIGEHRELSRIFTSSLKTAKGGFR
ncbi:MAG: four helix bundle protein [bacterium]